MARFCIYTLILTASFFSVNPASGGLRDISQRPQQMGVLSANPVHIAGAPYLLMPDNLTERERLVREEAIRLFEEQFYMTLVTISESDYNGETPVIWLATEDRSPGLMAALESTGIAGLGSTQHAEEYQLCVMGEQILLGGSDLQGLRWGLLSLLSLIVNIQGDMYVDQVYIRDWPDLPKRVASLKNTIRSEAQTEECHALVDQAYYNKMNEIEWDDIEAGRDHGPPGNLYDSRALELRNKIKNMYEMKLYMSCDRGAWWVEKECWQEAIPVLGAKYAIRDSFSVVPETYTDINITNSSLDHWSSPSWPPGAFGPTDWPLVNSWGYQYMVRDNIVKHSGTSSAKFTFPEYVTEEPGTRLRRWQYVGPNRLLKLKFWYKLQNFNGVIAWQVLSPDGKFAYVNKEMYFPEEAPYDRTTTQNWTLHEVTFCTYGADTVNLRIGPFLPYMLFSHLSGTCWIDDISIEPAGFRDMIRRSDTPLEVYKLPDSEAMTEGVDYRVIDHCSNCVGYRWENFVKSPRLERIPGGRLSVNDTVVVNWSAGIEGGGGQKQICMSLLEPFEEYQSRIRKMDSLMHPDGVKLFLLEVFASNYDQTCLNRSLTTGQIVGKYVNQLCSIIRGRRLDMPIRANSDWADEFNPSAWANPAATEQWNAGAIEEVPSDLEFIAFENYTTDFDSSLEFFAQHGHETIPSVSGMYGFEPQMKSALAARNHENVVGLNFYSWQFNFQDRMPNLASLAWNLGPFIIHSPPEYTGRPDTVRLTAEIWSDNFMLEEIPQITAAELHYRILPYSTWRTADLVPAGVDMYEAVLDMSDPWASGIEYYLSASDHRDQTRTAPADAPAVLFRINLPMESGQLLSPDYLEVEFEVERYANHTKLTWPEVETALWYEIHQEPSSDIGPQSPTLVARQASCCSTYTFINGSIAEQDVKYLKVYAVLKNEGDRESKISRFEVGNRTSVGKNRKREP